MMDLKEDSSAGTAGHEDIYQSFLICLNYEMVHDDDDDNDNSPRLLLVLKYGIRVDSFDRLFLTYIDREPLVPAYYSFGSRTAQVEVINARVDVGPINGFECETTGDCQQRHCRFVGLRVNNGSDLVCVDKCPSGFRLKVVDVYRNLECQGWNFFLSLLVLWKSSHFYEIIFLIEINKFL